MSSFLSAAKILAIQFFFGTTFFLAAWLKWSAGVPIPFLKQFGGTWLAHFPGGLSAVYYLLAVIETVALLGLVLSFLRGEFLASKTKPILKLTLISSLFVFTALSFGSRLTGRYDVAAINLLYFLGALISCREAMREERESA